MSPIETTLRSERSALEEVVAAAWERGDVPQAAVREWIEARREAAATFLASTHEEREATLARELQSAEEDLRDLEEGRAVGGGEVVAAVLALGARLRWLLWLADASTEAPAFDPLALIEEEAARARVRLEEACRLDPALEERAAEVRRRLEELETAVLEAAVQRTERELGTPAEPGPTPAGTAALHWRRALEVYAIERRYLEEGRDTSGLAELKRLREVEIEAAAAALARAEPSELARFAEEAANELHDRAASAVGERAGMSSEVSVGVLELLEAEALALSRLIEESSGEPSAELSRAQRKRIRRACRGLRRLARRLKAAETEARVARRLEDLIGARNVERFELALLVLLFGFLAMVFVEWWLPENHPWLAWIAWADLALCSVFQFDFVLRWALSGWSGRYFLRHFFVESLPAFPYGFAFHYLDFLKELEEARAVIIVRLLRLERVVRLRPLILLLVRLFRVFVFLVRGTDRLVERFRGILDRDIVVFDPDPVAEVPEAPNVRRAHALETRRLRVARRLDDRLEPAERLRRARASIALLRVEAEAAAAVDLPVRARLEPERGEIHLERVVHNLLNCDVARTVGMLGRDGVERLARWLRLLDLPGLRRLPGFRRIAAAVRSGAPAEAVSAAVHALGEVLQELLGAVRFWGDLSGITTGPQILDRVATGIILATQRPAMRLLVIGGLFVIVWLFSLVLPLELFEAVATALLKFLGVPILVLGSVCLVFLAIGRWLKKIAGEAISVYLRTADAHFYPLLKARKVQRFDEDVRELYRSVFLPEVALRAPDAAGEEEWIGFLKEPLRERGRFLPRQRRIRDARFAPFADDREIAVLLYRDFLDGPVLHRSDDKICVQLLGSLVLQEVRTRTLGFGNRELRRLERLALERRGMFNLGPAFWFQFITESLAIETAKLVIEYNTTCIPLAERERASKEAKLRFEHFLAEHRGLVGAERRTRVKRRAVRLGERLMGGDFTAFDFLGASAQSDAAVEERYGREVLEALRRDRRGVVRDIFGTRPYHLLPRNRRVFNPYRLYKRYLGGARFLFLPFVVFVAGFRFAGVCLRDLWELVEEVLGRRRVLRSHLPRTAGFDVAVRKINRMRKPFFMEALRLRAAIDIEYLGLAIPGIERRSGGITYREHLDFIGALEAERREFEALRERTADDLHSLRAILEDRGWLEGGLDTALEQVRGGEEAKKHRAEVLRALATAFVTDQEGLRTRLTAPERARRFFRSVFDGEGGGDRGRLRRFIAANVLAWLPGHRRRRRLLAAYLERERTLKVDPEGRRRLLGAFLEAPDEIEDAVRAVVEAGEKGARGAAAPSGTGPPDDALLRALEDAVRDRTLWTRKIVTVRAVQAIAVLDIECYREMVWDVGGYADD